MLFASSIGLPVVASWVELDIQCITGATVHKVPGGLGQTDYAVDSTETAAILIIGMLATLPGLRLR